MNIQQDSDAQRLKCNARVVSFPLAAVYGVQLIIYFFSFFHFFQLVFSCYEPFTGSFAESAAGLFRRYQNPSLL